MSSIFWFSWRYCNMSLTVGAKKRCKAAAREPHARMRNQQREHGRLGRHSAACGTVCGQAQRLCGRLRALLDGRRCEKQKVFCDSTFESCCKQPNKKKLQLFYVLKRHGVAGTWSHTYLNDLQQGRRKGMFRGLKTLD
jgi:hypothetical protein